MYTFSLESIKSQIWKNTSDIQGNMFLWMGIWSLELNSLCFRTAIQLLYTNKSVKAMKMVRQKG